MTGYLIRLCLNVLRNPWDMMMILLGMVLLSSALGVVYTAHQTRQLYGELQALQQNQDQLDSEYARLLLEQSAWADFTRVDNISRNELEMRPPQRDDIQLVGNLP